MPVTDIGYALAGLTAAGIIVIGDAIIVLRIRIVHQDGRVPITMTTLAPPLTAEPLVIASEPHEPAAVGTARLRAALRAAPNGLICGNHALGCPGMPGKVCTVVPASGSRSNVQDHQSPA